MSLVTMVLNLTLYSSLILFMPISDPEMIALVSVSSSVPNPKMEYLIAWRTKYRLNTGNSKPINKVDNLSIPSLPLQSASPATLWLALPAEAISLVLPSWADDEKKTISTAFIELPFYPLSKKKLREWNYRPVIIPTFAEAMEDDFCAYGPPIIDIAIAFRCLRPIASRCLLPLLPSDWPLSVDVSHRIFPQLL